MQYLDSWIDIRRNIAALYRKGLSNTGIILPIEEDWAKHVYHLYVIRCSKRDELRDYLSNNEIQTGIHYPVALPKLKAYAYTNQAKELLMSNSIDNTLLSLPIGDHLEDHEVQYVIDKIIEFEKKTL